MIMDLVKHTRYGGTSGWFRIRQLLNVTVFNYNPRDDLCEEVVLLQRRM